MIIHNNFLQKDYFNELQKIILGDNFPWFWNNLIVDDGTKLLCDQKYNGQLVHTFYDNDRVNSGYFKLLEKCIDNFDYKSLIRIKVNLTTSTETVIKHAFHEDSSDTNAKTTILYLNTCNGFTEFKDGTRVNSVENKAVTFNSNIHHTGSTCSDKKIRVVLNFVYYDK
tara:strand:- start:1445 stop:1948 length:504 start_codon:yes stop_codon:yes gene_type:complete